MRGATITLASILLLSGPAAADPKPGPTSDQSAPRYTVDGGPVLAGADFRWLVLRAHGACPSAPVERLSPAGLLQLGDDFRAELGAGKRHRLDRALPQTADGGIKACAGHNGASCDALAYVRAFRRVGLAPAFVAYVCAPGRFR